MKRLLYLSIMVIYALSAAGYLYGADHGTAAEAEAMVKKAITYLKANGKEKTFAEINNRKGPFVDRDLYITVYDLKGTCLSHGMNGGMIGKNLIELKDPDGVPFVKERMELARTKGKFWQDYKFTNPLTKKVEPKSMYCEKVDDIIVACGIYKK
jgi:cytochrome c